MLVEVLVRRGYLLMSIREVGGGGGGWGWGWGWG